MTVDQGRTALYRLYDAGGNLLYVGITGNPDVRFAQHAAEKDWWPAVASRTVEWYGRRLDAECAEQAAIKAHVPAHNYAHSPEPPVRMTVELNAVQARGVDLLCRALSKAAGAPTVMPREDLLWCLVDRELAARGLLGNSPCYVTCIGWPESVSPPLCQSVCRNPACPAISGSDSS